MPLLRIAGAGPIVPHPLGAILDSLSACALGNEPSPLSTTDANIYIAND